MDTLMEIHPPVVEISVGTNIAIPRAKPIFSGAKNIPATLILGG